MIDLFLVMAVAAITVVLTDSSIFEWARPRLTVLNCSFCTSFWITLLGLEYCHLTNLRYLDLKLLPIEWPALVCLANVFILLIRLSYLVVNNDPNDQETSEA